MKRLLPTMRLGALLVLPVVVLLTTSPVVAHGGPGTSIDGYGPGLIERQAIDEALHEDDPDVGLVDQRYGESLDPERRLFEARLRRDDAIRILLDEKRRNLLERLSP